MAYRGRGRGRFGGGGGFSYARQEPFDLFPEIELPDPKNVKEERALVVWNSRLTNYFKSSPCYLEEIVSKEIQSMDIERFSDRGKPRITSERDSLDQFLQLTSKNFPKELIGGLNKKRPNKKVKWTADLRKLDDYEKRELMYEMRLYTSCLAENIDVSFSDKQFASLANLQTGPYLQWSLSSALGNFQAP
ncbi:hypothetical protein POTOM_013284 [Populus tomentosa]|uniref:Uncharacterized protein n=1 Tax=Populus tomentosa TaxID=118781 RepID=A0A8X8D7E2_POPTO|nr:hypothetical protein POTOM_013284 [Populus tomentosa]